MKAVRASLYLFALAVCAAVFSACPKGQPDQAAGAMGGMSGPPPVAVVVAPVEMRDYAPAIELNGEIRASQRALLAAEVAGKVLSITHRVGEEHGKDDGALIQIDPATYEAALAGAEAGLAQAVERLRLVESGPREQEIEAQRALVAAAQAQYEQALDNLERQRELYDHDVVPESAVVAAEKQAEALAGALESQQQVLDRLLEGSRAEDIAAAKAAVDAAKSGVTSAELALKRTGIAVPFDAEVSALFVEEGTFVGPGTPVAEVVSSAPCEAWFNLPQDQASNVQSGGAVELRLDALPDEVLPGSVISVAPAADESTRQFPVRVACADPRLMPGMAARARILTATLQPTLVISEDAAVETKLGLAVYRMVPAGPDEKPFMEGMPPLPSVEQVPVETGAHFDGMVVVVKGDLKPGDMVVTRGKEQLYTSAKIIPTNLMQQGGPGGEGGPPAGAGGAAPPGEAPGTPEAGAAPGQGGPPATEGGEHSGDQGKGEAQAGGGGK